MSQLKIKNGNSWESIPAGGVGVPSGGTAGQVLIKSSSTDYATEWGDKPGLTLLWTNSDTNADFSAQTVSVNLSPYIAVYIEFAKYKGSDPNEADNIVGIFIPVGHRAYASGGIGSSTNLVTVTRDANVSSSGVVFSAALIRVQGSASSTSERTAYMIPWRIYGIKL